MVVHIESDSVSLSEALKASRERREDRSIEDGRRPLKKRMNL